MLSGNQIKYINSLKLGKFRNIHQAFIAESPKLVNDLLDSIFIVRMIFATRQWLEINNEDPRLNKIDLFEISEKELKKISSLKTPNQVLAVAGIPMYKFNINILQKNLILVLDDIRDPGNMGTIIRTANWFGIRHIVCSRESVDVYNPKVIQSTMGSIARVKIYYKDLAVFLQEVPDEIKVYGTVLHGRNIYKEKLAKYGIIIIGNESRGISKELLPYITGHLSIPSWESKAESLNASVAAAIVISEFRRK
ncbi:MAG: RNA methyltransferase [Bacteroidetes bacterium]|nr:RNA methyltransferase [Bacteroidota bacterium]